MSLGWVYKRMWRVYERVEELMWVSVRCYLLKEGDLPQFEGNKVSVSRW